MQLLQKANSRENNFNFLRFLAASLVIFSHNFWIFGLGFEPFYSLTRYTSLAGLAVYIFFIISGFLITKSWTDKPNIIIFFQKRLLRIYPALVAAIFFGVFIIGPLVTSLSFKEFITNHVTWDYVKSIFLYPMQYNLPGVFTDNPCLSAVNSSLWTLPIEVFMYFSIAFIGVFGLLSKKAFVPALLVGMIFLDWYTFLKPEYQNLTIFSMPAVATLRFAIFFYMGSLFYLLSEKIFLDTRLAVLALVIFIISLGTPYMKAISYFTLPYLIIYFAFEMDFSFLRNFGKYGDFSYGMYVFAFPVQQTLIHFYRGRMGFLTFSAAAFIITLFSAFISWNLIEKRALKLKSKAIIF